MRVPFTNSMRPVARVHTASNASGSSGTLRPHREVFSVDANGSVGLALGGPGAPRCSVNARVDASGTPAMRHLRMSAD